TSCPSGDLERREQIFNVRLIHDERESRFAQPFLFVEGAEQAHLHRRILLVRPERLLMGRVPCSQGPVREKYPQYKRCLLIRRHHKNEIASTSLPLGPDHLIARIEKVP